MHERRCGSRALISWSNSKVPASPFSCRKMRYSKLLGSPCIQMQHLDFRFGFSADLVSGMQEKETQCILTRSALPYDWAVAAPALTENPFCLGCCCLLLNARRVCNKHGIIHRCTVVASFSACPVLQPLSRRE